MADSEQNFTTYCTILLSDDQLASGLGAQTRNAQDQECDPTRWVV